MDNDRLTMRITITASPWTPKGPDRVRRWSAPPPKETDDDLAARVERAGICWPFQRWTWAVWSPFDGSEAAAEGTAPSMDEAMSAADGALRGLIASVETDG